MSAALVNFTPSQAAMLTHYPPYQAVEGKNTSLIVYEKFAEQQGIIFPAFTKGATTHQAFVVRQTNEGCEPVTVDNGKTRFVECLVVGFEKVQTKEKEGFFYSGQIINVVALAYFTTLQGERKYLSLNGNKAAGGALENSDTVDERGQPISLPAAVAQGALRELAEEMFGLDKAKAKKMNIQDIIDHIQTTTKCEKVACSVLIKNNAGNFERLPEKEFNNLMLSPTVMINLGTCFTEDIQNALKKEEGKTDVPEIIDEAVALGKGFRNAAQVAFHKNNPEAGFPF